MLHSQIRSVYVANPEAYLRSFVEEIRRQVLFLNSPDFVLDKRLNVVRRVVRSFFETVSLNLRCEVLDKWLIEVFNSFRGADTKRMVDVFRLVKSSLITLWTMLFYAKPEDQAVICDLCPDGMAERMASDLKLMSLQLGCGEFASTPVRGVDKIVVDSGQKICEFMTRIYCQDAVWPDSKCSDGVI